VSAVKPCTALTLSTAAMVLLEAQPMERARNSNRVGPRYLRPKNLREPATRGTQQTLRSDEGGSRSTASFGLPRRSRLDVGVDALTI